MGTLYLTTRALPGADALSRAARTRRWRVHDLDQRGTSAVHGAKEPVAFYGSSTSKSLEQARKLKLRLVSPPLDLLARLPYRLTLRQPRFSRWSDLVYWNEMLSPSPPIRWTSALTRGSTPVGRTSGWSGPCRPTLRCSCPNPWNGWRNTDASLPTARCSRPRPISRSATPRYCQRGSRPSSVRRYVACSPFGEISGCMRRRDVGVPPGRLFSSPSAAVALHSHCDRYSALRFNRVSMSGLRIRRPGNSQPLPGVRDRIALRSASRRSAPEVAPKNPLRRTRRQCFMFINTIDSRRGSSSHRHCEVWNNPLVRL
jgi:hypothetical protein